MTTLESGRFYEHWVEIWLQEARPPSQEAQEEDAKDVSTKPSRVERDVRPVFRAAPYRAERERVDSSSVTARLLFIDEGNLCRQGLCTRQHTRPAACYLEGMHLWQGYAWPGIATISGIVLHTLCCVLSLSEGSHEDRDCTLVLAQDRPNMRPAMWVSILTTMQKRIHMQVTMCDICW